MKGGSEQSLCVLGVGSSDEVIERESLGQMSCIQMSQFTLKTSATLHGWDRHMRGIVINSRSRKESEKWAEEGDTVDVDKEEEGW